MPGRSKEVETLAIIRERGTISRKELKILLNVDDIKLERIITTLTRVSTIFECDNGDLGLLNDNRQPFHEFGICRERKSRANIPRYFCKGSLDSTLATKCLTMGEEDEGKFCIP